MLLATVHFSLENKNLCKNLNSLNFVEETLGNRKASYNVLRQVDFSFTSIY